ncbi:DUF58 domain-containing protein [Acetobacteraceae bacterium KSS8]|uniref:DUF58 domain-containing protein n=1 Tax=Endosaccharibacter trunci TaxID=2812733 RepID=A0ABT1W441_9PROT|nr:DUF58 domain-containing protein [Acetobacteraceae bacterium KSS8]
MIDRLDTGTGGAFRTLLRSLGRRDRTVAPGSPARGAKAAPAAATATATATGRAAAEALAARLPPLLADAEHIAASMACGVHGRLRAGVGDSFWQYRPLSPGESTARIDWRQSARGDRLFVRETEWEAAQTVCVWRDRSPSMGWRSTAALPTKRDRAELVLLALGIGLLRGGEHVSLLDDRGGRTRLAARGGVERLATLLLSEPEETGPSLPAPGELPRHAGAVLIGDFLSPPDEIALLLSALVRVPVRPILVQILDPAELALPFEGRTRFEGMEGETPLLVPQAGDLREGYAAAMHGHRDALARLCAATGVSFLSHDTSQRPETLLLALHDAIAPRRGAARIAAP